MDNERVFYRTIITYEVLSDAPLGSVSLEDMHYMCTEGHCSGQFGETRELKISAEEMEKLLIAQGTDPIFLLGEEDE